MTDWLVDDSLAPVADGALAPLFAAAADGVLALPHCAACGTPLELDQYRCDACAGTDVDWRAVPPSGTVHAVTTVHRREPGLIRATGPYHLADVELASGHRLIVTTDRPTTTSPAIGDAATIVFRQVGGVAVPALATGTPSEETT